ncbi:hypothetical protein EJ08DRAFT_139344 [Tothia fuscella]|uniref:Uncharacterized protein n=1 Tax=Tothia fuscella TaxID=1048955 RepID=A0A9P4NVN5_9PEZI|nr:hypothetical protein EJ08DRAFT_139344 [Tothia fuscella]
MPSFKGLNCTLLFNQKLKKDNGWVGSANSTPAPEQEVTVSDDGVTRTSFAEAIIGRVGIEVTGVAAGSSYVLIEISIDGRRRVSRIVQLPCVAPNVKTPSGKGKNKNKDTVNQHFGQFDATEYTNGEGEWCYKKWRMKEVPSKSLRQRQRGCSIDSDSGCIVVTIRRCKNVVPLPAGGCNYEIHNTWDAEWDTPRVSAQAVRDEQLPHIVMHDSPKGDTEINESIKLAALDFAKGNSWEYMDTPEMPYAKFVFKYRSAKVLQARLQSLSEAQTTSSPPHSPPKTTDGISMAKQGFSPRTPLNSKSLLTTRFSPEEEADAKSDDATGVQTSKKRQLSDVTDGESNGQIEKRRKSGDTHPVRVLELREKIVALKAELAVDLKEGLDEIDSLKDTREKEWKETTKFKAIADENKRSAKKHFKTYMKARTEGRRTKNAYVKQKDEGNVQISMLYSAYLGAGGEQDNELEWEIGEAKVFSDEGSDAEESYVDSDDVKEEDEDEDDDEDELDEVDGQHISSSIAQAQIEAGDDDDEL